MTAYDELVAAALQDARARGLLRTPGDSMRGRGKLAASVAGGQLVDACSNDYLGLGSFSVSRETLEQFREAPVGAGASRLIHGTRATHELLEQELAEWVGLDAALLFTSGYAANVGLLQAIGEPGVVVCSDALNHASIIDGCRLSRAQVEVVPHGALEGFECALRSSRNARARFLVTESYFSMDGDGTDLRRLRELCDRYDAALVVDEAHALGVFGPEGSGRCRASGVVPDILVGTLGKAVGVQGAFVAGSERLRLLLWNRARSFVFSTAPSPWMVELIRFHVKLVRQADGPRVALLRNADSLRSALARNRLPASAGSSGPIVPVPLGDDRRVMEAAQRMADRAVLIQGIRPPTVPPGTARIRLTAKATWTPETPELVARALVAALEG